MDDFKEFQGKSLDEAIRAACSYFDAQREKLEIDIIQDAKNGIFGLVGARKAIVRARRAQLKPRVGSLLARDAQPASAPKAKAEDASRAPKPRQGQAPRPPRGNREPKPPGTRTPLQSPNSSSTFSGVTVSESIHLMCTVA